MALGEGKREVPDSEDEPMTSSPVNTSDDVAHKLCMTAPAPPQDAQDTQDALQKAARPHQETTANVANLANDRTGGLDADQSNASINIDAASNATVDIQPDNAAATQCADTTAISKTPNHELTLAPIASSVAKTDMTTHTPPADNANELVDAKTQQWSAINETTVAEIEQQQTSSEAVHEANETTNSGAELSQPGLQTTKGSHRDSIEARDTGSHHPEACASHEVSSETVSSQDDTALRPGGTARAVEEIPVHDYDRSGNEDKHQPSTDESLQGQAEDLGNTLDAKHADDYLELRSDTDAVESGHNIPEQPENRDILTALTSSAKISQAKSDSAELEPETEEPDTAMDVDFSSASNASDAPHIGKEEDNSSHPSTSDNPQLSTPTSAEGALAQNASEKPMNTPGASTTDEQAGRFASSFVTVTQPSQDSQSSIPSQPPPAENVPIIAKTPQEIALDELKAQKSAMLATLAALPAIRVLMEENASSDTVMSDGDDEPTEADIMAAANKIVKDHIKLLHEYNELKDVGQGLMGLIADQRGVRIVEVQEEFGIDAKD